MIQSDESVQQEFKRGAAHLATALLGVSLGVTAIFFYTQGVFIRPLQDEFGWTRGEISTGATAFALALAIMSPLYGIAVDRLGVRVVTSFSILCLSGSFFALSRLDGQLSVFVILSLAMAVVGAGTSAVPYVRLVSGWFAKARGLAIGLTMVGTGIAAAIAPAALANYIAESGWRAAYVALALAALVPLPFVLIWGRDRRAPAATADAPRAALPGATFKEAIQTPRFWLMGLTFALAGCAILGMVPHFPPMLQDAGVSPPQVGATMSALGLAVIAGRAITGFALDRIFAPYIATVILLAAACGFVGLAVLGPSFSMVAAVLLGLAMGSEIDMAGYMSARYFGLRSYGAIFGLQYGLFSLGGAAGPMAAGLLYDHFGDYRWALFGAAGVLVLGVPLVLSLGRYPTEEKAASSAV